MLNFYAAIVILFLYRLDVLLFPTRSGVWQLALLFKVHVVELFTCLKKLHETFIALAAHLQGIHEQIKVRLCHKVVIRN